MKAITISRYGAPEVLTIAELPDPEPVAGEILVEVKAFGLNHAETYMRSGRWGDVAQVTGIEAAGVVAEDPSGGLAPGTPVVAIMGGMGRTRNGAYAELVTVPASNVVAVETGLDWADLAAIPEVYATAWSALHDNLALAPGATVLVRGATSALGQAAVNIAADLGATVVATTRSRANAVLLEKIGATAVLIDDGDLAAQVHDRGLVVDALLDLVGNSVLLDSVAAVRPRGPRLPGRIPRRAWSARRFQPDRRSAQRGPAVLLRQFRPRDPGLPARGRPADGTRREGSSGHLPRETGAHLRLRGDRARARGDGVGHRRRQDDRRPRLISGGGPDG
nr:zinc-binding dehydrogenase [Nocardia tengchongensis]